MTPHATLQQTVQFLIKLYACAGDLVSHMPTEKRKREVHRVYNHKRKVKFERERERERREERERDVQIVFAFMLSRSGS